jgi:recombinational DNA repair protein (RecF pathway)
MHRSEDRELLACAACGSEVDPRDAAYAYGGGTALCFACAVKRGGAYDAEQDHWFRDPDISDLPHDENV